MTPKDTPESLLAWATRHLAEASETARLDAELLLAHVLGVERAWLIAHSQDRVETTPFQQLVIRRSRGEPLAYIVGFKDFWTLRLKVTPAVLVPRPETEILVERALALPIAAEQAGSRRLLDVGTGSGAIALALASERPAWHITATDVSPDALAIARSNALELNLNPVEFLHGSWFEPVAGRRFEVIVSNPPYIAGEDPALASASLRYEPLGALTPGIDGLAGLNTLIREAPRHLASGGWLLLEHGSTQGSDVASALVAQGFHHVTSRRDLAGHERMTEAQWL